MKAVIMAGGMGTRLRAVTGDTPKPMADMLGKPMMEHIVELLKTHGFDDICVSLRYRAGDIMAHFGDGSRFGVKMQYRVEESALGTAGGVKNCADFFGNEDFLVISGDAACDFDLALLMAEHKNRGAAVTLALYRHPEPLRYGLTVTDGSGLVRSFIEKPDWSRVVTDLVNTGIYAISPGIMDYVPDDVPFDFARDLFPQLMEAGELLVGLPMEGYWCDVGDPLSYYRCCADALSGKLRLTLPDQFASVRDGNEEKPDDGDDGVACPCRSRAELMGTLSELMLDMGADYSDGIRLSGENYSLHIAPLSRRSAIRIAVRSEDTEFARELAESAKKLAEALDL